MTDPTPLHGLHSLEFLDLEGIEVPGPARAALHEALPWAKIRF